MSLSNGTITKKIQKRKLNVDIKRENNNEPYRKKIKLNQHNDQNVLLTSNSTYDNVSIKIETDDKNRNNINTNNSNIKKSNDIANKSIDTKLIETTNIHSNLDNNNGYLAFEDCFYISVHCHICKNHFNNFTNYKRHVREHYQTDPLKTWKQCDLGCHIDPLKPLFGTDDGFISHISQHTKDKPFKCKAITNGIKCKAATGQKCGMVVHWKTHYQKYKTDFDIKNSYYVSINCHICDTHFNDYTQYKQHLKQHYVTDTHKKWGQCDWGCQTCFKSDELFISHISTHTTKKPFTCTIITDETMCQSKVTTASNLRKHWKQMHNLIVSQNNNSSTGLVTKCKIDELRRASNALKRAAYNSENGSNTLIKKEAVDISQYCGGIHLSNEVKTFAEELMKKLKFHWNQKKATAAACVYIASKQYNSDIPVRELCEEFNVKWKAVGKIKKQINKLKQSQDFKFPNETRKPTVEIFIDRYGKQLKLDMNTITKSQSIGRNIMQKTSLYGKRPSLIGSCAIYLAGFGSSDETQKKSCSEISNVSRVNANLIAETFKEYLFPIKHQLL